MSGQIFTYPIENKVTKEEIDEFVHYSTYKRFKRILGEDVNVNVVTYGIRDEDYEVIKKIDGDFNIIKAEEYIGELDNLIGELYKDGKLRIVTRKSYYCRRCNTHYSKDEVKEEEIDEVYNIVRVRIGRRLYFIDKIKKGYDPVGLAISDNEDLIYVQMGNEIWIAPADMKDVLINKIEVPEQEIMTGKFGDISKNIKIVKYVAVGNYHTGYLTKRDVDEYNLKKRISSYSVIYSVTFKVKRLVCPKCGDVLKEVNIPKLHLKDEKINIEISADGGAYRMPILYCNSCGHFEHGDEQVKNCPICGNVMERPFFYNPSFITVGAYYSMGSGEGVAFLHEKRQKYKIINEFLKANNKKISDYTYIIRSKYPEEDVEQVLYMLKNRGKVGDNATKIRKLKNVLENLKKYIEIYGKSEPRDIIDNWMLYRTEQVKRGFISRANNGNFKDAFHLLYNFAVKDISRFYVSMRRKESILEEPILDALRMFLVFDQEFSEEFLSKMNAETIKIETTEVLEVKGMEIVRSIIRQIMKFRKERGIPRREPLKKVVFVSEKAEMLKEFSEIIMRFTNVLVFYPTEKWEEMDVIIEPDVEAINRMYRSWAPKIAYLLKRKNIKDVMNALNVGGYTMGIEGFVVRITPDMVKFIEKVPKGYVKRESKYGDLYFNTERDITTMRIRMVNEVIRRINYMRKDINMDYDDVIDVSISSDNYILRILKGYTDEIKERTRARNVDFEYVEYAYVIEWPIMDFDVIIGINPLFKKWVIKAFMSIPGIAENKAETLFQMGYGSVYELMQASPTDLAEIPGFSMSFANKIKEYLFSTAFKPKKENGKNVCPFCGTELSEDDDFCPHCGAPIRVEMEKKEGISEGKIYLAWGDFSKVASIVTSSYKDEKKVLITKEDPDTVKKEYNLKNTSVIWISYVPMGKNIKPKDLESLKDAIIKNLAKGAKIVMWDAFDFMVAINGFDTINDFIKEIKEEIQKANAIMLFNVEELEDDKEIEKLKETVDGKL